MISVPGIGSGLDINSLVSQLVAAEGDAKTFLLASKRTDVETEISAFGALKGALSSFKSSITALATKSTFSGSKLTSSDPDVFTVSGSGSIAAASYDIEVVDFAEAHKLLSGGFADSDAAVGTGTLNIAVGAEQFSITIDSTNNTLKGIREAINGAADNTGVSATIANLDDGLGGTQAQLILTSGKTGIDNSLTITVTDADGVDTDGAGLSLLYYDPADATAPEQMTEINAAADAQIKIDGQTVTNASNVISNAIEGVTFTLLKKDPGVTHTLTVEQDKQKITEAVNGFINNYNAFIGLMNNLTSFNADTGERGALIGNRTLLTLNGQIRRELSRSFSLPSSSVNNLVELGVTTTANGSLSIDSAKLSDAIESDLDAVIELFASEDGIAGRLNSLLNDYVRSNGILDTKTKGLNSTVRRIDNDLAALDRRLGKLEAQLMSQFTALDVLLNQLQQTSSFLTTQLAAVPTISVNSK